MRARSTSSREAISASCSAWNAGDFELLDRAPAGEPGGFERLFARDIRGLDFLARDDLGLLDLAVGVDALGALGGERDHALLVGDLDRLLLVDIEHLRGS
jgi:hypothetical protein